MILRVDFVFSYWIFIWNLLYIFKLTKNNPSFALLFGLFENAIVILAMLYYQSKSMWIFLINVFIFKGIPLLYLASHNEVSIRKKDMLFTATIFLIYLFWVNVNSESILHVYNSHFDSLINDKNETPFMYLATKYVLHAK